MSDIASSRSVMLLACSHPDVGVSLPRQDASGCQHHHSSKPRAEGQSLHDRVLCCLNMQDQALNAFNLTMPVSVVAVGALDGHCSWASYCRYCKLMTPNADYVRT